MAICVNCGKETEGCLCKECSQKIDIEELCEKIRAYFPKKSGNQIWEEIASGMEQSYHFRNLSFALADYLPSPRKEFQQILTIAGTNFRIPKASRGWFWKVYEQIITSGGLSENEKLKLKGFMLESLYQSYCYPEAEALVSELSHMDSLPSQTLFYIAEFYSQTRRYNEADNIINLGEKANKDHDDILDQFSKLSEKNKKRKESAGSGGRKEYLPKPGEGKEEAIKKYKDFMTSIGIDITVPKARFSANKTSPTPIPKEEYPNPIEKREADFDSFVAFDFETTGFSTKTDCIIEVGAVRVVNGQITESVDFTFQEFVKPYKKRLSDNISKLTGITNEDLINAREMWEVIPDFMKFVGEDIMVGYNSIAFDAKFLCRAGRYAREIYSNKHFDVMKYVNRFKDEINYSEKDSLSAIGNFLGIENPEAHRALADAVTTAKIYLKIKEMIDESNTAGSVDSGLDLEDW